MGGNHPHAPPVRRGTQSRSLYSCCNLHYISFFVLYRQYQSLETTAQNAAVSWCRCRRTRLEASIARGWSTLVSTRVWALIVIRPGECWAVPCPVCALRLWTARKTHARSEAEGGLPEIVSPHMSPIRCEPWCSLIHASRCDAPVWGPPAALSLQSAPSQPQLELSQRPRSGPCSRPLHSPSAPLL